MKITRPMAIPRCTEDLEEATGAAGATLSRACPCTSTVKASCTVMCPKMIAMESVLAVKAQTIMGRPASNSRA